MYMICVSAPMCQLILVPQKWLETSQAGLYSVSVPCTLHQTSPLVLTDTNCQNSGWQYSHCSSSANKMSDLRGAVTLLWKVRPIHRKPTQTSVILKHGPNPNIHTAQLANFPISFIHNGSPNSFIYQPLSHYSRLANEKSPHKGIKATASFLICSIASIV